MLPSPNSSFNSDAPTSGAPVNSHVRQHIQALANVSLLQECSQFTLRALATFWRNVVNLRTVKRAGPKMRPEQSVKRPPQAARNEALLAGIHQLFGSLFVWSVPRTAAAEAIFRFGQVASGGGTNTVGKLACTCASMFRFICGNMAAKAAHQKCCLTLRSS